jgi:hypothetical protein
MCVCRHGWFEQYTVAAGLHQAGKELGVTRVVVRAADEAQHRRFSLSELDLEIGIEVVRNRQVRVQRERSRERGLRLFVIIICRLAGVHRQDAIETPKSRPCRRVIRIFGQTRQVQIAGNRPVVGFGAELVRAQVALVRFCRRRHVATQPPFLARAQRE